ncbi:MAG: glucosamine-6-phosphate deaminase [Planctomycetes bacterium]|nr:glucosamine-6-phosphate deaminase [Planctomycetota bacterium]
MQTANVTSSAPQPIVLEAAEAARVVAREIAELVRAKAARGERAVLGLATGKTPVGVYHELVRLRRDEGLSFANVTTFNLDEFVGVDERDPRSFRAWMRRELFDLVDLDPARAHVPRGVGDAVELDAECARYRASIAAVGGIDLQLVGIGRNGHVAFNEPGSSRDSRMRVVELSGVTRADLANGFGGLERVPAHGLTLGIADVLAARAIRLLAFGEKKHAIVARALEGPIGPELPATFLREHRDARWIVDPAAASQSR